MIKNKKFFSEQGSITVEYSGTMIIAALIMLGVLAMFTGMCTDLMDQFKEWVTMFE